MIKFEHTEIMGWEAALRGMRNPMNSWEKSDSGYCNLYEGCEKTRECDSLPGCYEIGPNDMDLMRRLAAGGPVHAKYRRMITVYVDITAPLYWWKEFDTYKVGTVANSCSTMHKIHAKEFTRDEFSCEHLLPRTLDILDECIMELNIWREIYLNGYPEENGHNEIKPKDKKVWWQMIQLLPSSYNQRRTVMMNYEVLAHVWNDRRNHKLDEWCEHKEMLYITDREDSKRESFKGQYGFCDWIKTLPYSELITGRENNE